MLKKVFLSVLVIVFVVSCVTTAPSQDKEKFDDLQKSIRDSENAIKLVYDYKVKMGLCEDVISSIDEFVKNSNDKELITSIQKTRSVWVNRYYEYVESFSELLDSLENEMQKRAIETANNKYRNAKFESIELIDRNESIYNNTIYLINTYKVITRGTILGVMGNIDNIAVRGEIDMRNDKVNVTEVKVK